ncbi:piggyBac transposable element-derived protein 4-like [Alosa sapidissima]|uniref:piggyBac transposable element-derived protein 4-like n=1 Tax=Alosa sapidissima TaxID=34773 RepID=UPI001C095A78|nr:piggyBac transposable element-derived protein 4-like [Alosa sapidissima]
MSTLHKDAAISTEEHLKPHIILDYNRNKGGVDCLDKLTGTYTCKRKTARWPVVVFHNILDVSAYNAFVVWTAINPAWNHGKPFKRRLFIAELGKALATPSIHRRQHLPRTPASASLVRSMQGPSTPPSHQPQQVQAKQRKRCTLCAPRNVETGITCHRCNASICKGHCTMTAICHLCV